MPNPNLVEAGKATRFKKGQPPGPGRPKQLTITEALNRQVAERAAEIADGYFEALAIARETGDARQIIAAVDAIVDRVEGKPTQRTETTDMTLQQLITGHDASETFD